MSMSPRLLRPRATGFNPKSISGLKLWLDVANTSSLTFNGSTVSQVNDLSGNGFHATQGTANNQPTYQATGLNNKPTLYFDSTDSLLSSATIADYFLTPTTAPTFTLIMACYSPLAADGGQVVFGSDAQASGRVLFGNNFGGLAGNTLFDTANASGGRLSASITQPTAAPHVMTFYRHGAAMAFRVDGVTLASKANASGNFSVTSAKLQIGKCDAVSGSTMYMSEAYAYAAALSTSDLVKAERGLGKKWGVAVA
jgi:hypothetical protein